MPTLTKAALNKLLVAERKAMREKQRHSDFMRRTLSIYKNQVARAAELSVASPDYTLEQFRELVTSALATGVCGYNGDKINAKTFVADHAVPIARGGQFTLDNLVICCKAANFQKGIMTDHEFRSFNAFLVGMPAEVTRDIRKRLTTGGKFLPGQQ